MPDQNVLLAVDGSPSSERALELLSGYRGEATNLAITALNVQTLPMEVWPEATLDAGVVEKTLLETGEELAGAAAQRLSKAGLRTQKAVRLGLPADGILREAEVRRAALVVMGTRGHGAMHGFALGSVAMRVAHGGDVPVCLVQPESKLPAQLGRKLRVLLALDGSEPALRAARLLAAWRGWLGELDVQIAYVQQPLTLLATILPAHRDVIEQWSTRAGEEATQAARDLFAREGIRHHLHLSVGDPSVEIAHLADEAGCELVVAGTRGRGAAHHALVGSVALKTVARSALPVLLVK
jgi:nucleotide-binding universal stress UspA family protein